MPEGFRGCELHGIVARPEASLGVAEGGDAALGGDTGTGEDGHGSSVAQPRDEVFRYTDGRRAHVLLTPGQAPNARRSFPGPPATGTIRCSPVVMSRNVQTPPASSSSPIMAANLAPIRSACLNCPLALLFP